MKGNTKNKSEIFEAIASPSGLPGTSTGEAQDNMTTLNCSEPVKQSSQSSAAFGALKTRQSLALNGRLAQS